MTAVKPLGQYDTLTGECFESPSAECTPSKTLNEESNRLANKIVNNTGTQQDIERLAVIGTILIAREVMSDRVADDYIRRLSVSPLYKSLEPKERVQMWLGLTVDFANRRIDKLGFGDRVYGAENSVVMRDWNGKIIGFTSAQAGGSSSLNPSAAVAGGFGGNNNQKGWLAVVIAAFSSSATDPDERASMGAGALLRGILGASAAGLTALGVYRSVTVEDSHDDNSEEGVIPGPSGEYGNYIPNKEWGGTLPGIPGAVRVKSTGQRQTFKDDEGNCYEWDRQHGTVEKYDKRGNHLGEYDPVTGTQTDLPIPSRRPDSGCRK